MKSIRTKLIDMGFWFDFQINVCESFLNPCKTHLSNLDKPIQPKFTSISWPFRALHMKSLSFAEGKLFISFE